MPTHSRVCAFFLLSCLLTLLVGGCSPKTTQDSIKDMSLKDIKKYLDDQAKDKEPSTILLIDARSPKAFAAGHIPDARNMTLADFPDRLDRIGELDKRVAKYSYKVVYGEDRGSIVAQALVKRMLAMRYDDVYMYMGGLDEWRKAGLPVTPPATAPGAPAAAAPTPSPTAPKTAP